MFSCTDSWKQEQLHPVLPELGLVGQQTGEAGIIIGYQTTNHTLNFIMGVNMWFNFDALVPSGILEVLHCILIESPEALHIIQKGHIKSIISLLYKHGRNHKVGANMK